MADEKQEVQPQPNEPNPPELEKEEAVQDFAGLFVPIVKVDEEKREVYGYASIEERDHTDEVMDYASSKPFFSEWSEQTRKRSGGKSLGNIRAMHSNIAAGKAISFKADDAKKGFYLGAKITNPAEWDQVKEGVYTGFSVGGRYVKRWYDGGAIRYTAQPTEISLVDAPAVPSATFQLVKRDGSTEERPFRKADLPGSPTFTSMPVVEERANKSPETFHTLTLNINVTPTGAELAAAGNPAQKTVEGQTPGSSATDNGPVAGAPASMASPVNDAMKNSKPGENTMPDKKPMTKDDVASALSTVQGLLVSIRQGASADQSSALDQAQAVLSTLADFAPSMQQSAMATQATQAVGPTNAPDSVTVSPDSADSTVSSADVPGSSPSSSSSSSSSGASTPPSISTPGSSLPSSGPSTTQTVAGGYGKDQQPDAETVAADTQPQTLEKGDAQMPNEPLSTVPPLVNINTGSYAEQKLPAFMAALEAGSMKKAREIADFDQFFFDELVQKAQKTLLDKGGWTYRNLRNINSTMPGPGSDQDLAKAIQIADLPNVYLIRLAKLMLPLYAGLRRRLPFQTPPVGSNQATWRAELGTSNFSFSQALSVAELSTGQAISESFLTFNAPFRRIALNDKVSLEAVYGSRGFDDPLQVAVIRALTLLLGSEERKILGDNSGSVPGPASVTATSASTGGTLAAGTYTVRVSSLTYRGWLAGSVGGASPTGESVATSNAANNVTTGSLSTLTVTWPSVKGAVAYNVYIDNQTNSRYVSTVTIPTTVITAFPGAGGSQPASDTTANANGFEGIISWADFATIYSNAIPNKTFTDQAGSGLTTYAGGITEFDTLLSALWTNWQIAPSLIVTSANGAKHLTKQLLSANNPAIYRFEVSQERGTISGGAFVTGYVNKFAPFADGTPRVVDVMAHPYMPDGSYKFITESITYPMARESRGFALEGLIPYTYFPLAQSDISYPFAMLCSETLECFHPGAQAAINGVDITK